MPSDHRRRRDRDREALLQAALPQRPRLREHQRRRDRAAGEELRVEVEVDRPWQVRPHRLRPQGALGPLHPAEEGERARLRDGGRPRGERHRESLQRVAAAEHPGLHRGHLGLIQDREEALPAVHHRAYKPWLSLGS